MKKLALACTALALLAGVAHSPPARALGNDDTLGAIGLVGFNFCPRGTLEADGRLLQISGNEALFSLYGTAYGGNGTTTFALPDLRNTVKHAYMRKCVVIDGFYPSRS